MLRFPMQSITTALLVLGWTACAAACPFCGPSKATLSEEMAASDVVVIADLIQPAKINRNSEGQANGDS
ncbi:MAG: hypothetical protein N2C14_13615, partial [Planctomycetales bacterium]